MNLPEKEIVEQSIKNLGEFIAPQEISIKSNGEPDNYDGVICINGIDFVCEVKANVTNANFIATLKQLVNLKNHIEKPILLIAKYIYPNLMNELAFNGFNVLDAAGNCFIRHGDLLLKVKGEKISLPRELASRSFQDAGIKLIFYLLRFPEDVNRPYRYIQEKTGISLGSIKNTMEELTSSNFILQTEKGRFLKNKEKLLERWVTAYNEILKPKLLISQMAFKNNEKRERWLAMVLPEGMYWGGESGANMLLNGYLHPGAFDIYTDIPSNNLLKTGFVAPQSDGGDIKIYQKFWLDNPTEKLVPFILIYADLMGSGDSRCLEVAQKILENELSDFK